MKMFDLASIMIHALDGVTAEHIATVINDGLVPYHSSCEIRIQLRGRCFVVDFLSYVECSYQDIVHMLEEADLSVVQ